MANNTTRRVDIVVGTRYDGAGVKLATTDIGGLQGKIASMAAMRGAKGNGLQNLFTNLNAMKFEGGPPIEASDLGGMEKRTKEATESFLDNRASLRAKQAAQIRIWRENNRRQLEADVAKEASNPEREGRNSLVERMSRGITPEMERLTKATRGAGKEAGNLLDMIERIGLTSGPERIALQFKKLGAAIGVAAAVAKVASIGLEVYNFNADMKRHEKQGNLERQLEDEKQLNETKRSVFIIGNLAYQSAKAFNLNNFAKNQEHIEESEDYTKRLNSKMERQQSTAKMLENARLGSRAANVGLDNQISGHLKTPEQQAVLAANAQLNELNRRISEVRQNNGGKIPQEMQEELVNRKKVVSQAIEDEERAHLKRMVTYDTQGVQARFALADQTVEAEREAIRGRQEIRLMDIHDGEAKDDQKKQDILEMALFEKKVLDEQTKFVRDEEGRGREALMRANGFSVAAEKERLERELKDRSEHEKDSKKVAAMRKATDNQEEVNAIIDARQKEDFERDHQQRIYDQTSSQTERLERLSGDHYKADRESLVRQRQDRINEIDKTQREELRAHGERADQINKQATESRLSAQKDYEVGLLEMQMRLGMQFRVNPTGTTPMGESRLLTGTGSQFKQGGIDADMLATLRKILARLESGQSLLIPGNYPGNN